MSEQQPVTIPADLMTVLRCPVTGTALRQGTGADEGLLVNDSPDRPLGYPIRSGVPVLLAHEATALDRPA
ncbi:hypothetical protein LQF12_11945 [Ruania suaedae]|uniref:Trm112 family protein n=1 Tax=Ruania suaedae TaxID=2897774 RepID=UPI001E5240D9|nr:hypothetical protein [Ruania suaedae]UFU02217.1 hypothetical protein LQF12_11945 [Ruania suaedae]